MSDFDDIIKELGLYDVKVMFQEYDNELQSNKYVITMRSYRRTGWVPRFGSVVAAANQDEAKERVIPLLKKTFKPDVSKL